MRLTIALLLLLLVGCGEDEPQPCLKCDVYKRELDKVEWQLKYEQKWSSHLLGMLAEANENIAARPVDTIYLTIDRIETLKDTIYREVKCDSR